MYFRFHDIQGQETGLDIDKVSHYDKSNGPEKPVNVIMDNLEVIHVPGYAAEPFFKLLFRARKLPTQIYGPTGPKEGGE